MLRSCERKKTVTTSAQKRRRRRLRQRLGHRERKTPPDGIK